MKSTMHRKAHFPTESYETVFFSHNFFLFGLKEMYEISPYATFSVSGGRTTALAKTPIRGVTPSALDYTVQFKTFGHPDGDLNAYPVLPNAAFGHVKGKSSWQNQRYYNSSGTYFMNPINS